MPDNSQPANTTGNKSKKYTDQKIETAVGRLLQIGVSLSAIVVLFGAFVYLIGHHDSPAGYRTFHNEPADFRTVRGILHSAVSFNGRGIIQLGLLLLIATPVVRVAFSILGFARERDWMYVVFTVIVLAILTYSLLGS